METPLYQHQIKFLQANPDVAMLVHGLGSGKTRTYCEWAKKRLPLEPLFVVPKGLKENQRRECEKWGLTKYKIISKEEFKRDCKSLTNQVLIIDEADHFFSPMFKSQLSKALRWYIDNKHPNLLMGSGTPYRSSSWNIFVAGYFLGHKWSFQKFKYEFFDEIHMGFRVIPKPKKGSDEKLKKIIANIADVFRVEDGFDIPPQIDETVHTGETKEQIQAHKSNQEILPIVRFTQDHQIESGIGLDKKPINNTKLELIRQYAIDESKIAVVCRYRAQLDHYAKTLTSEGHNVFQIHGDVKDRSGVLDQVASSDRCVLLLQSATCEGYEAPSIPLMIFASLDFSYRNYQQVKGRIHRMNNLKKNVYVHLIAGSSDKAIMQAMSNKSDFDVLKYMKEQKLAEI